MHRKWRNRRGVLEVQVTGVAVERFLNLAAQEGVVLSDVRWGSSNTILCWVKLDDVKFLHEIARASRTQLHFKRRWGWPFFLQSIKRRRMLAVGAVVFLLLFYLAGQVAFDIQVNGASPLTAEEYSQIVELAAQKGVAKGKFIGSMDFDAAEKHIMLETTYLTFTDISAKGNQVTIEVAKRRDVLEGEKPLPHGNIVAAKDAVIESVLVTKGEAMVSPGDQVKAGDVIILGYDSKGPQAAAGIVRAKTTYQGEGECPLTEKGMKNSGRSVKQVTLAWNGESQLLIGGEREPDYEYYSQIEQVTPLVFWRNIRLPVEVVSNEFFEQTPYEVNLSAEEALEKAITKAQNVAQRELPLEAKVIESTVVTLEAPSDTKKVRVVIEAREDISEFAAYDVDAKGGEYAALQKRQEQRRLEKDAVM